MSIIIKYSSVIMTALFCLMSIPQLSAEYALGKDDAIRMTVFLEEDLTTNAKIGKTGDVSFPLIGSVNMLGLTLKEAETKIKELYEEDFLQNAQVNLAVVDYARKWVIVGGDVRSPGTITYLEDGALDLRGAIAQAGGAKESANLSSIILRRKSGKISRFSLSKSGGVVLRHGDSVTVGRLSISASSITVTGKVLKPGVLDFPKQGSFDILTAVASAGGFSQIANSKVVTVRRGKQIFTINYRKIERGTEKLFYMKAGDILHVSESRF